MGFPALPADYPRRAGAGNGPTIGLPETGSVARGNDAVRRPGGNLAIGHSRLAGLSI